MPKKQEQIIDSTNVTFAELGVEISRALKDRKTAKVMEHGRVIAHLVFLDQKRDLKDDEAFAETLDLLTARAREIGKPIAAAAYCSVDSLFGLDRDPRTSRARQELWRKLRAEGWAYPEIGRIFFRDHTTIVNGVKAAEARAKGRKLPRKTALPKAELPNPKSEAIG